MLKSPTRAQPNKHRREQITPITQGDPRVEISASSFNPASVQRPPVNQQPTEVQEPVQASPRTSAQELGDGLRAPERPQQPDQPQLRNELSPEEKNNVSDELYDRSNEIKADKQEDRDSVRATVVQISVQQQQKANLELYIEQSTGEEIDDSASVSPQDVIEFSQKQQRNENIQAVADSGITEGKILEQRQQDQRQSLLDKISQALGDNSNPPSIDLNV